MDYISIFHWLIVLAVILVFFGGRKIAGGGGRGGGPHVLPARGAVERSHGAANPKDSRPVGSDKGH